jgi:hypothetical protein
VLLMHPDQIFVIDSKSREQARLYSPAAGTVNDCSFSSDNRALYFTVVSPPEADVWLLSLGSTR